MKELDVRSHSGTSTVACIGVFDGVHLGHQRVIGRCIEQAREAGVDSVVVTFDRDPEMVLMPDAHIPQVCTLDQKRRFIEQLAPDGLLVLPFDEHMASRSPREFLDKYLCALLQPRVVVVGANFRFGARGRGDVASLREYGHRHGFSVEPVPLLEIDGEPVSSTRIRTLLSSGEVAGAARLLGRPFEVEGVVVAGAGRGRHLGFHTANVSVPAELAIPGEGVYGGAVVIEGQPRAAAINVGSRPTFETQGAVWVEVHVIDAEVELYGTHLEILFLDRIREERYFAQPHDLQRQMATDIDMARDIFSGAERPH